MDRAVREQPYAPVNRFCHSLGIPLIVASLALAVVAIFYHPLWMLAAGLFVFGWLLQFIGTRLSTKSLNSSTIGDSCWWAFRWWAKMQGKA